MTLLPALGMPWLLGCALVRLFWPEQPGRDERLLRNCLAIGLGFGLSSCTYFLQLVALGPSQIGLLIAEAVLLATLLVGPRFSRWHSASCRLPDVRIEPPHRRPPKALVGGFILAAISALASGIVLSAKSPHGRYDAWCIWNLRARFLFRGGSQWTDAFSGVPAWSHPDYPLLIPANVARGWEYLGHETVLVPMAIGILFTIGTVGLAYGAIARLRGHGQACLAGLLLCGTPLFIELGISQYADVPLSFFILVTVVLISLRGRFPDQADGLAGLAGLAAGFAAWTKNEGVLWVVAVTAASTLVLLAGAGWRSWWDWLRPFALGVFVMAVVIAYFKTHLAPPNDLLSQSAGEALGRLADPSRYAQMLGVMGRQLVKFGDGVVSLPLLLTVYAAVAGFRVEPQDRLAVRISVLALLLMLAGYGVVYLTSLHDLNWHLRTSLYRLLEQLWPSAILVYLLSVPTPEDLLGRQARLSSGT